MADIRMNALSSIRLASFAAALALLALNAAAHAARAYIGTYTSQPATRTDNHGEGIYLVDIDPNTGEPRHRRFEAVDHSSRSPGLG